MSTEHCETTLTWENTIPESLCPPQIQETDQQSNPGHHGEMPAINLWAMVRSLNREVGGGSAVRGSQSVPARPCTGRLVTDNNVGK